MIDVVIGPFCTLPSPAEEDLVALSFRALENAIDLEDAVNNFTRAKLRESGFYRRIMPPTPITDKLLVPTFTKDVDELRNWAGDVRQTLTDNAVKDMLAEEDARFMSVVVLSKETMDDVKWGA